MISVAYLGMGGQGIVFAATITGEALYRKNYYVAQLQNYGASVRGGSVLGYVVADEKPVENPFVEEFNIFIVVHEEGMKRWKWLVEKSKLVILDKDLVKTRTPNARTLPLSAEAEKTGLYQSLNMVAVGLFFGITNIKGIDEIIENLLRERKNYETNLKAYLLGKQLAKHISSKPQ